MQKKGGREEIKEGWKHEKRRSHRKRKGSDGRRIEKVIKDRGKNEGRRKSNKGRSHLSSL